MTSSQIRNADFVMTTVNGSIRNNVITWVTDCIKNSVKASDP